MIQRALTWMSDQINAFIVSVSAYVSGMIFGEIQVTVNTDPYIINQCFEHYVTVSLQWFSFSVSIAAGLYALFIAHKRYKEKRRSKK